MKNINICCAIDSNYVQHFLVMLHSLIESHKTSEKISLFILHDNLAQFDIKRILDSIEGIDIAFINVGPHDFSKTKINGHISKMTYARLLIGDLLKNDVEFVIYLDSDIVVLKDISELWYTNIAGYIIGGVQQASSIPPQKLGLMSNAYFNAGVLLIDLIEWRKEKIGEQAMEFIVNNSEKLTFRDQCGLNYILQGKRYPVNSKRNVEMGYFYLPEHELFQKAGIKEIRKNPYIVHFTGNIKPRHRTNISRFQKEYYKFLKRTPYFKGIWKFKYILSYLTSNKCIAIIINKLIGFYIDCIKTCKKSRNPLNT